MLFSVLHEDNHLLVVNKPAHLPTMGVPEGQPSLLAAAKEYIKQKYNKPGNVYLGIVSRLDAPVTGAVVIARTSKAAARLTKQFRERSVQKCYWTLLDKQPDPREGPLVDWLRRDERHRRMHITTNSHPESQEARLTYKTIRRVTGAILVEVELHTGRKHQIRVQLSHHGIPILGDRKYNSRRKFPNGIALHARCLTFEHPVLKTTVEIIAPLPTAWREFGLKG
jgi:23S rRNA pseudouridine1911/1915/1917 synthase